MDNKEKMTENNYCKLEEKKDSIFYDIPKHNLTIKCSECDYKMIMFRDTFLFEKCPKCGKIINYPMVATSLLMSLIDLFGAVMAISKNEVGEVK